MLTCMETFTSRTSVLCTCLCSMYAYHYFDNAPRHTSFLRSTMPLVLSCGFAIETMRLDWSETSKDTCLTLGEKRYWWLSTVETCLLKHVEFSRVSYEACSMTFMQLMTRGKLLGKLRILALCPQWRKGCEMWHLTGSFPTHRAGPH